MTPGVLMTASGGRGALKAAEFAKLVKSARPRADGTWWDARCPAHDDRKASLSFRDGDRGLVVTCQAHRCTVGAIAAAVGKRVADLFPSNGTSQTPAIAATYDYTDAAGAMQYQVVRMTPKDFRCRRPNGNGWAWNMAGVERVPYHLPDLAGRPRVYVTEGEKDADRLAAVGLAATTNEGGAGKWRSGHTAALAALSVPEVVCIPDHDGPGEAHACAVATACLAAGLRVKVLRLSGLPDKGDVSDWLDAGHTAAELEALADAAPTFTPAPKPLGAAPESTLRPLGEVLQETVGELRQGPPKAISTPFAGLNRLLGTGFLPSELVMIGGRPGSGKSAVALEFVHWAASHGDPVAMFSVEMTRKALGRRILAQSARVPAISFRTGELKPYWSAIDQAAPELGRLPIWIDDETSDVDALVEKVKAHTPRPALVVADYLQLLGAAKRFQTDRARVEYVAGALRELAKQGFVVVALSSLSRPDKRAPDRMPTIDDLRESGALGHHAHIVLLLHRPAKEAVRTVCHMAKARDAQTGYVNLAFRPEFLVFEEPAEAGDGDEGRL